MVMSKLIELAKDAAAAGEVPVAAAIVDAASGEVLATAVNRTERDYDPTAHAECLAIRAACQHAQSTRLPHCDLYVTLEPCAQCAAAISFARIRKLVFGAYDPKSGAVEHGPRFFAQSTCHHAPEVIGGVMESECADLLREFFRERRE